MDRGGPNDSFHRPTTIELIVEPHYRIYYKGPLAEELAQRLAAQAESLPHLSRQRVLLDVSRGGRGQAGRADSQRSRVGHLRDSRSLRRRSASLTRKQSPVRPRRRLAPRAHRRPAFSRHAQRPLRGPGSRSDSSQRLPRSTPSGSSAKSQWRERMPLVIPLRSSASPARPSQ